MELVGAIHSIGITQRRGRFLKRNLMLPRIGQGFANIPLKYATVYTLMISAAAATNPWEPQATISNRFSHGNWHSTENCLRSTKAVRMGDDKQQGGNLFSVPLPLQSHDQNLKVEGCCAI